MNLVFKITKAIVKFFLYFSLFSLYICIYLIVWTSLSLQIILSGIIIDSSGRKRKSELNLLSDFFVPFNIERMEREEYRNKTKNKMMRNFNKSFIAGYKALKKW